MAIIRQWQTGSMILAMTGGLLSGCGGNSDNSTSASDKTSGNTMTLPVDVVPLSDGDWYRPLPGVSWQWQLSGDVVNSGYDVELYDIDLFDSNVPLIFDLHSAGRYVICYFSAGSYENWRTDAESFALSDLGDALDDWEGERWLDIRSENVQSIMQTRLDLAVEKGCDGVEPDNMDGYSNANGVGLSASDQLAYNRFIANEAHRRGLSVALKNDLNQIEDLVDYFDFAVNEQCAEYDECSLLEPFINADKAVLQAEYADKYINDAGERAALCSDMAASEHSLLFLPLLLDDTFRYRCD